MSEKVRRCPECGMGSIRPTAKAGRTMPYRNMPALSIPSDFAIPTCDHCGEEGFDSATTEALDVVLEHAYQDELRKRADAAIAQILESVDVSQRRLEQLLGLSAGYLSRVRAHRGEASAALVSTLSLVAQEPKRRLAELDRLWATKALTAG